MLLPFPLPSRPTELIQFRQPNIADAMRFNSITPEEQEQQTTAYLKALLAEPRNMILTWTAQDRITALWWIFTGSRETRSRHSLTPVNIAVKSILRLRYECSGWRYPSGSGTFHWRYWGVCRGYLINGVSCRFDGWAMEMLEMRRQHCHLKTTRIQRSDRWFAFWEFAYQVSFITMLAVLVKIRLSVVMKRLNGWPLILNLWSWRHTSDWLMKSSNICYRATSIKVKCVRLRRINAQIRIKEIHRVRIPVCGCPSGYRLHSTGGDWKAIRP